MSIPELFWNAPLENLKCGYMQEENFFICILCGKKVEKGIIYPEGGFLYEAEKYIKLHIEKEHQSVFDYIIKLDKKLTGLTDHQNNLLRLFYQGKSDLEIQKEMGIGSSSTIRNHRFILKEKERQAKVFLTLMELLREKDINASRDLEVNRKPKTKNSYSDGQNKLLQKYFPYGLEGGLQKWPLKEKERIVVLREIAAGFRYGILYSEKEINEILKTIYDDYVTLRRFLIEYGFLERKSDGSQYWLKKTHDKIGDEKMDRKKELKQQYQEMKTEGGIYQIRNTKNQKLLVVSTPNFKTINGKRMELQRGGFRNEKLQEEWNQYGEDAFTFDILETLKEKEDPFFNKKEKLKELEEKWLAKLNPYGEKGYNKPRR